MHKENSEEFNILIIFENMYDSSRLMAVLRIVRKATWIPEICGTKPAKPPKPPRIKQSIQITTHFHSNTLSLRASSIASKNQNGFAAAGQREETTGSVCFPVFGH